MEAQANPDELKLLLVQAEVEVLEQEVEAYEGVYEVEASEVEEKEKTYKLSETSESREPPPDQKKMMAQMNMSQHRRETSRNK